MEFMYSISVLEREIDAKKKSGRYTYKRKNREIEHKWEKGI